MPKRSRLLAWTAAAFMILVPAVAVGCGDDDDDGGGDTTAASTEATTDTAATGGGGGAGGETIDVAMTDFAFNPADPSVAPGEVTIKATNDGQTEHAVEVEGPNGEVESDTVAPGAETTFTADLSKPGTYEWYCPISNHRDLGMEGEITVK